MSTPSHVKPGARKDADVVVRVAAATRRSFKRRRAPADLDDVHQDAALGAAEALATGNLDVTVGAATAYARTAARRAAGLGVSRALSVVSFPKKLASRAREWQHRAAVAGCGYGDAEDTEGDPPVEVVGTVALDRSASEAGANAVARLGAVLVRHVNALPPRRRVIAEVVLGLRPGTQPATSWREVVWRTGATSAGAHAAINDLIKRLKADAAIRDVDRDMMPDHGEGP